MNMSSKAASTSLIIDVRSPGEFASGHVRGAVNIPLDRLAGDFVLCNGRSLLPGLQFYAANGLSAGQ
jgi:3-mercaptopyruvate sulfurtransferase SseA